MATVGRRVGAMLVAGAMALAASGAAAAPNCKKGKPCGNACIAQSKTCRLGSPASPREPGRHDRNVAPTDSAPAPREIRCRWSGKVYRVPEALCRNGGGWPEG